MSHLWTRSARARSLTLVATLLAALGVLALFVARADAVPLTGSANPLPGSTFEGGDGNQEASSVLRTDWASPGVNPISASPDPNANDNIFAGGAEGKENNPGNWNFATQDGGSTPGKNNILDAYTHTTPGSAAVFLDLAFTRGDATGTTYMAFELNQRADLWNNGKVNIPCRTTGDIIVSYQVSGNSPDVILQRWTSTTSDAVTGCGKTGTLTDYTAVTDNVNAQGAVNAAPIQNYLASSYPWPGNMIPAKLFGEASLNLTSLLSGALGSPCFSFGSIWMHTRASTSDSSNLDDYVAPRPLLVRNCSASGTKFHDLDGDGVKDTGEPGLAGFRMWADYDEDGVRDAGEPFGDTNANGDYVIAKIQDPSGTYAIREQLTEGTGTGDWTCSYPASTAPGGAFPCAYTAINGATTPNVTGKDFGNYKQAVIKVAKQTVPDGATDAFAFTSTLPGKAGFSLSDGGFETSSVKPGTYTATETLHPDFDLTGIACSDADSTGTGQTATFRAQSGETITCTFTNTRKTGKLTVRKVLDPANDPGTFDLKIGDDVVVDDGGHLAQETRTLPTGTGYTVSEAAGTGTSLGKYASAIECRDGETVVKSGTGTSLAGVPVIQGHDVVCTFTNTRRPGKLTVVKDLVPATDAGRFDLRIGGDVVKAGAGDGESGSKVLAPGDYDVSELAAVGTSLAKYDASISCDNGQSDTGSSLAGVHVDSNDDITCTITNTRRAGKLTVVKDLKPADDPGRFDLKIGSDVVKAGAGDGDAGSKVLAPGEYDVSELAAVGTSLAKYDASISCDNGQSDTGSSLAGVHVDSNENITCTITNERRKGSVTVVKDLVPASDGGTFDLKVGDDVVAAGVGDGGQGDKDVAPGTYTVSEAGAGSTSLAKYDKAIACTRNGEPAESGNGASLDVAVDSNDTVVCTITNTRRTGSLQVVKDLEPADDEGRFDLKIGGDVVAAGVGDGGQGGKNVAPGTYAVSEVGAGQTDLAKYDASIACMRNEQPAESGDGSSLAGIAVDSNDKVVCTITNERRPGSITVIKDLVPASDGGTFDLKVGDEVVKAAAGDGDQGAKDVAPGTYAVSEAGAGSTSLAKYDKAIACTRNGQPAESGDGASLDVAVESNDTVVCTITNTRRAGKLTVVKDLKPADDPGRFDLRIGGDVVKAAAGDGDQGEKALAPGDYTVSEVAAEGTDLSKYDQSIACTSNGEPAENGTGASLGGVTIDSNDEVVCTITNERRTGSITVVKDLLPADDDGRFDLKVGGDVVKAAAGDGDLGTKQVGPGTYGVSEVGAGATALDDYDSAVACVKNDKPYHAGPGTSLGGLEVDSNDKIVCTITNVRLGSVTVAKTEGGADPDRTWTFRLTGGPDTVSITKETAADGSLSFGALKPGTYTLCEINLPAGWHSSLGADGCVDLDIAPGEAEAVAVDNTRPATIVIKEGNDVVHHGDTITYTFDVSNAGNTPLKDVTVQDDRCDAAPERDTANDKNDDGDALLEAGEVWRFTCTVAVGGDHAGDEENPILNVATAHAFDKDGNEVTDDDPHSTTILHPGIAVNKELRRLGDDAYRDGDADDTPLPVHRGDTIEYRFTVTNTGDTPLTVAFSDPMCDEQPSGPDAGDTDADGKLDTGETWTYRCSHVVTDADADPLDNTVTVTGTDVLGGEKGTVTDEDTERADIAHPDIAVDKQVRRLGLGQFVDAGLQAHVGETLEYRLVVTDGDSDTPIAGVELADPRCDAGTLSGPVKSGGNADELLEDGEAWTYTCTHVITDTDPNPLPNTATATGHDTVGCPDVPEPGNCGDVQDEDTTSVQIISPKTLVVKEGNQFAYPGDTVTFTFAVTNAGDAPLHDVAVTDDRCAPVTGPTEKRDGNADDLLDPGETWMFTCAKQIPADHKIGDENPLRNVATATGKDPLDKPVTSTDDHLVRVLHPAIDIEKTGPANATVGTALGYTLTVTNPGDVPFAAQDVVVTDPRCEAPPAGPATGTDQTPGEFDPGDTWTYTCTAQTTGQPAGPFVNTATVTAKDFNGRGVTDTDEFPTVLTEAQQVLPEEIVSGFARLRGPSGCVKRAFNATVRGRRIASVTFYVDGKQRKRIVAKSGQRVFRVKVRPGSTVGVHRVTARVVFKASSQTKTRTLRLSYRRCARQVVTPQFTG